MAAIFAASSGLYETSYAPVTGNDCTIFVSVRQATLALNQPYVVAHDYGNDGSIALMSASSPNTDAVIYIDPNGAPVSTSTPPSTANSLVAARYTHLAGVWTSATSRTIYVRRSGEGRYADTNNTTSKSFSTATGISIGQKGPTPSTPTLNVNANCEIANVILASKALPASQIYRLLNGEWPPDVIPSRYLTMWYPLINDKRCRITGIDLTQNGTVTLTNRHTQNFARKSRQTIGWTPALAGTDPIDLTGVGSVVQGATATLTATNAGSSTGTVSLAGASQTVTSWSNTSIDFTVDRGTAKYGGVTIVATTAGATSSDSLVGAILEPISGGDYTDLADPLASSGTRITALPDLAGGDQLSYYGVTGGGVVTVGTAGVLVNSDGTFSADSWVTGFYVEANDGTGWGTAAFQDVGAGSTSASSNLSLTLSL